jgi:hypothetical protein
MSQQSQPTYYPVEKSLIDKNNNQITPHESIIVEKDSGFVQTTINQLRHLFELAINESFVLLPPQDAAQYFDHPFNQSPYFEIIYNTLTMLFSHVAKQSLVCFFLLVFLCVFFCFFCFFSFVCRFWTHKILFLVLFLGLLS